MLTGLPFKFMTINLKWDFTPLLNVIAQHLETVASNLLSFALLVLLSLYLTAVFHADDHSPKHFLLLIVRLNTIGFFLSPERTLHSLFSGFSSLNYFYTWDCPRTQHWALFICKFPLDAISWKSHLYAVNTPLLFNYLELFPKLQAHTTRRLLTPTLVCLRVILNLI